MSTSIHIKDPLETEIRKGYIELMPYSKVRMGKLLSLREVQMSSC